MIRFYIDYTSVCIELPGEHLSILYCTLYKLVELTVILRNKSQIFGKVYVSLDLSVVTYSILES